MPYFLPLFFYILGHVTLLTGHFYFIIVIKMKLAIVHWNLIYVKIIILCKTILIDSVFWIFRDRSIPFFLSKHEIWHSTLVYREKYSSIPFMFVKIFFKVAACEKMWLTLMIHSDMRLYTTHSFCATNVKRNNRKRLTFHSKHLRPHSRLHKLHLSLSSLLQSLHSIFCQIFVL